MKLVERRIGLLFALFLLLLGAATARAAWLGTVKSESLGDRAVQQQIEELVVPAPRGTIMDRHGVDLAVSEDAVTVFAHPFLIDDPAAVAARLAPLIGRTDEELLKKLSDRDSGFVYLRRRMDASLGQKIEELGIEGIDTVIEPKRSYPQGHLAAQVLGMVGDENTGLSGLEYSHEEQLGGEDGERRLVKDALGEPVSLIETDPAEPGEDLRLTLDSAIQFNYEPGSTFKAFTVAGALEEGLIEPHTPFQVPPTIQVADREIGEAHDGGGGTLTTADILARSSNVGTVMVGLKLGVTRFDRWVRRFGFSKPTGVDLPGENQGIVLDVEDYSGSSIGNMPIGQGISVTPIQMASAFTAIANGGGLRRAYIVGGDRAPRERVPSRHPAT